MRFIWVLAVALFSSALALSATQEPAASSAAPAARDRFDMKVRADFFAGISGDEVRFKKAMTMCEEILADQPDHAEALVWHGSGLLSMSGQAFQQGDAQQGMQLWMKGLGEMNKAVALAPDNVAVRIPRAATLLEASRFIPDANQVQQLLKVSVGDFEHVLSLQKSTFATVSDHGKGELLFGLADGWARLGDKEKATQYFTRLTEDAAKSGRVTYAKAWLAGDPPKNPGRCIGCH